MPDLFTRVRRFLRELKRRNVYRVAATYAAVAFFTLQAAQLVFPATTLEGIYDVLVVIAFVGFPLVLVGGWAFEITPDGVRRTVGRKPQRENGEGGGGGVRAGYRVLLGLGLLAAAVAGSWHLTGGGGGSPDIQEGTVVVLPFQVSGEAADTWSDGMVTLLSTKLDGAANLRAIADRTVIATWKERQGRLDGATTSEALSVAREVGAQYAVVGSAVQLGDALEFSAVVHNTESDERLGQVRLAGVPDSVTVLADRLAGRILGVLAQRSSVKGFGSPDLASVMTRSLPALKSYLAAERHYRSGDNEAAVRDYRAAIESDSSFALPWARLALIGLWHGDVGLEAVKRAYDLSDQLPERSRRVVRALHIAGIRVRPVEAADSLRRLTADYPDDPQIWYYFGELLQHRVVPRGPPDVENAFRRAIALDPGGLQYYLHFIQMAFVFHNDSTLAAERIEDAPEGVQKEPLRFALDLAFGSDVDSSEVLARIDSFAAQTDGEAVETLVTLLRHPRDIALQEMVIRRARARGSVPEDFAVFTFVNSSMWRGQVDEAIRKMERVLPPNARRGELVAAISLGIPLPDSIRRHYLAPETLPDDAGAFQLWSTAYDLIHQGQEDEVDELIARIRELPMGGAPPPQMAERALDELLGYRAFRSGNFERAAELWRGINMTGVEGAILRGDLFQSLGQLDRAEEWYLAAWRHPLAHRRLGEIYEEMGRPEQAAAAYRRFIAAWKDADEPLQDRVAEARRRAERLTLASASTRYGD